MISFTGQYFRHPMHLNIAELIIIICTGWVTNVVGGGGMVVGCGGGWGWWGVGVGMGGYDGVVVVVGQKHLWDLKSKSS